MTFTIEFKKKILYLKGLVVSQWVSDLHKHVHKSEVSQNFS